MVQYTFYTNPMSRGQIVRWALHEVGADYDTVLVDWERKPDALLKANPMGKVPTLVQHVNGHDHVVTESGAICHFLAEMHPEAELLPTAHEMANYFRYMFFTAAPIEHAVFARAMGWQVPEGKQGSIGFGSYELATETFATMLASGDYVCGDRFTMADVYVGSMVNWLLDFELLPKKTAFVAYAERARNRPAYAEAKQIDENLIASMEKETA